MEKIVTENEYREILANRKAHTKDCAKKMLGEVELAQHIDDLDKAIASFNRGVAWNKGGPALVNVRGI
jgi:hypothetical protein